MLKFSNRIAWDKVKVQGDISSSKIWIIYIYRVKITWARMLHEREYYMRNENESELHDWIRVIKLVN